MADEIKQIILFKEKRDEYIVKFGNDGKILNILPIKLIDKTLEQLYEEYEERRKGLEGYKKNLEEQEKLKRKFREERKTKKKNLKNKFL